MHLLYTPSIWIPWAEVATLSLLLLLSAIQPRTIAQSLQTLSSPIQRRYTMGGNQPLVYLLRALFQWATTALVMLMAIAAYLGTDAVPSVQQYMFTMVLLLGVVLLKGVLDWWIQGTFMYTFNARIYYQYRGELWQVAGMLWWLVLLFSPWMHPVLQWLLPAIIMVLYMGLLGWKLMQAFGWSLSHIWWTSLYMIHAEVLPIAIVAGGISKILNIEN